jgi:bile acid:Na+ symporter, BASS family
LKNNNLNKILLALSGFFLIAAIVMVALGKITLSGPFVILFFILLSFGIRIFPKFKGLSFTVIIFAAVTAALFYPAVFTSAGNFQFKTLIVPLIQIIMFGMGSQMSFSDFTGIIKMPKGVLIGVGSHYIIMPMVGFGIAQIFNFPPEIKAGIILIGCVPSGLASNVMAYIAGANLALAVTIAAFSTLLSPFLTPFLMKTLGGQYIEVDFWKMMLEILNMIILPIVAGFIFNLFSKRKVKTRGIILQMAAYFIILVLTNLVYMKSKNADFMGFLTALSRSVLWFYLLPLVGAHLIRYIIKGDEKVMGRILSFLSMAGIAVILAIIVAAGRDSLLKMGILLLITSLLHNLSGYTLGYSVAWLTGMPEKDRRTVAFEVGMQNGGLASGLALQMGKVATVGLAPAIFGPLMNVTGSILASWWRGRPPKEKPEHQKDEMSMINKTPT